MCTRLDWLFLIAAKRRRVHVNVQFAQSCVLPPRYIRTVRCARFHSLPYTNLLPSFYAKGECDGAVDSFAANVQVAYKQSKRSAPKIIRTNTIRAMDES